MFQIKINEHNIHDEHPLLILQAIINSNIHWAMWEIDFLGGGGLPYGSTYFGWGGYGPQRTPCIPLFPYHRIEK